MSIWSGNRATLAFLPGFQSGKPAAPALMLSRMMIAPMLLEIISVLDGGIVNRYDL